LLQLYLDKTNIEIVNNMASVKISIPDQYHHENKTWNRLLEFFKQENTFLKNLLAEVLDHNTNKKYLALAKQFQNK